MTRPGEPSLTPRRCCGQPGGRIWRDADLRRAARRLRKDSPAAHAIAGMARQEERHLERFNALMAQRRVRPTLLQR